MIIIIKIIMFLLQVQTFMHTRVVAGVIIPTHGRLLTCIVMQMAMIGLKLSVQH